MINFLINMTILVIISNVIYKVAKFFIFGKLFAKKTKRKSILGKVWILVSNRIHYQLDQSIKSQKEKRSATQEQTSTKRASAKVIPIKNHKLKTN